MSLFQFIRLTLDPIPAVPGKESLPDSPAGCLQILEGCYDVFMKPALGCLCPPNCP